MSSAESEAYRFYPDIVHRPITLTWFSLEEGEVAAYGEPPEGIGFQIIGGLCVHGADPARDLFQIDLGGNIPGTGKITAEEAITKLVQKGVERKIATRMIEGIRTTPFSVSELYYNERSFVAIFERPQRQVEKGEPYRIRVVESISTP